MDSAAPEPIQEDAQHGLIPFDCDADQNDRRFVTRVDGAKAAHAYEQLLRETVPAALREIDGYQSGFVFRRDLGAEVEFAVLWISGPHVSRKQPTECHSVHLPSARKERHL